MTNHIYVKQIQTNTIAKLEYQAINLVDICSDIDDTLSNKDFETTWSIGVDYRDKRPQLRTGTFADFAKYLVNGFGNCLSNENKDKSGAVFPSSILPNRSDKTFADFDARHWITLDYDDGDIDPMDLLSKLSGYAFVAHTSFTSMGKHKKTDTQNGLKLKIWVPLANPIPLDIWGDVSVNKSITGRSTSDQVEKIKLFFDQLLGYENDASSFTSVQLQNRPAINSLTIGTYGVLPFWFHNTNPNAKLFDIADASHIIMPPPIKLERIELKESSEEIEERDYIKSSGKKRNDQFENNIRTFAIKYPDELVQMITKHNFSSNYKTTSFGTTGGKLSEKGPTLNALIVAGKILCRDTSKADGHIIYRQVIKPIWQAIQSATSTKDCSETWDATKIDDRNFIGFFMSVLSQSDKLDITARVSVHTQEWYNTRKDAYDFSTLDYYSKFTTSNNKLSSAQYDGSGITISPFGSGKTYAALNLRNDVLVAVPTQAIAQQNKSIMCVTWDKVFATLLAMKANPPKTLVIDEFHGIYLSAYRAYAISQVELAIEYCTEKGIDVRIQTGTIDKEEVEAYQKAYGLKAVVEQNSYNPMDKVTYHCVSIGSAKPKPKPKVETDETDESNTEEVIETKQEVKAKKSTNAVYSLIHEIIEKNNDELIYVVRDHKSGNEQIAAALSMDGIKAIAIDRTKINDESSIDKALIDKYAKDGGFEMKSSGVQVLLVTRLGVEGVNVQDKVDHASVIVCGDIEHQYLKQASGRFRNAGAVDLWHMVGYLKDRYATKESLEKVYDDMATTIKHQCKRWNSDPDRDPMTLNTYIPGASNFRTKYSSIGWTYYPNVEVLGETHWAGSMRYTYITNKMFYHSIAYQRIDMKLFGCQLGKVYRMTDIEDIDSDVIERVEEVIKSTEEEYTDNINYAFDKIGDYDSGYQYQIFDKEMSQFDWYNSYRLSMDQLFKINDDTNLIPLDMRSAITDYLLGKTRMTTIQHKLNQSRDPFVKEIRDEYKGKYLTIDEIRQVIQKVADNHIDRMMRIISSRPSCAVWGSAIDQLRFTKDNMWYGKLREAGDIDIKSAKEFAEINGILSFTKESKRTIEVDGEKKKIKTYLVG